MTLSDLSIRRPVFAWMIMAFAIIFGAVCFQRLGISQLPDVDFPVITVRATYQGAAPEVMERDVIDPIEDAVMGIQDVKNVTSVAYNGSATISIEFDLSRNVDLALEDVQAKVSQAQRLLPTGMDPIALQKSNPNDFPIMWLGVSAPAMPVQDLMIYVKDHVQDQLTTVAGVASLMTPGYLQPNLRVWVDNKRLAVHALTVLDVVDAISRENIEPPAGLLDFETTSYNLRTLGEPTSPADFGGIIINNRGGAPNFRPLPLRAVAGIVEGTEDVTHFARSSGKPSVGLGVVMQRGANAVDVADGIKLKVAAIQKALPAGMTIAVRFDSTRFIRDSVHELNMTLVLAALLTSVVCWLFLGSWSSTLNVLLAIPTSVLGTFIVLYFSGFTLNLFTLLGLSLAIGIVVDDSIMVIENIIRHRERGDSRRDAALLGAREITFAAIAASVSIVAIFLPIALMHGIIGKFLYQFGITMSAAVLLSLLEALTLTPMRASKFVDPAGRRRSAVGRGFEAGYAALRRGYERTLGATLAHPWWVLGAASVVFLASLGTVRLLNKEFLPAQDQDSLMIRLTTPVGSDIAYTAAALGVVEDYLLRQRPEVESTFEIVGGFYGGQENSAMVFTTLKPRAQRRLTQQQLMPIVRAYLTKALPNARPIVQDPSQRGFTTSRGFPIEFAVQGPDWDTLGKLSETIMRDLRATGLVTDLDSDFQSGSPEIQITPNRRQAAAHGVTTEAVAQTIDAMLGGVTVGKYPKAGHRYDVRVKMAGIQQPMATIRTLSVRNNRGELVSVPAVVNIHQRPAVASITRLNRARAITIFANVAPGKSQQDALKAVQDLASRDLKPGYNIVFSGSSQTFQETFANLVMALGMGLVIAYMVLATQFDSFIDPLTVLLALPFSFTGAFLGLLVTGQSLNMYSMIGLILLMGIVKKNSILLVDFTNQQRTQERLDVLAALQVACPIRLRPILMTSVAIIVGAVPAAAALGPGAESRRPMSIAVIGGVLVSTVLTLYVVPAAYSLFARIGRRTAGAAAGARAATAGLAAGGTGLAAPAP